jgi:hypothetical protein
VASGDATASDREEALRLARLRAELHMPGMFRTHYVEPVELESDHGREDEHDFSPGRGF